MKISFLTFINGDFLLFLMRGPSQESKTKIQTTICKGLLNDEGIKTFRILLENKNRCNGELRLPRFKTPPVLNHR